ncbi:sigma-70 family RNA polymerase sigma factor [Spirillospora sp. NPDC049024]
MRLHRGLAAADGGAARDGAEAPEGAGGDGTASQESDDGSQAPEGPGGDLEAAGRARGPDAGVDTSVTADAVTGMVADGGSGVGNDVAGDGLTRLFRTHHLSLVRLAVLLVGDQGSAEDVVQDVYARMQRRHDRRGRGGGLPAAPPELLAYARAAVLNACRTLLRRRALTHRLFQSPQHVWSAESDALIADDRRRVFQALTRLPARQREAIVLRYYLDLSEVEIAAAMGVRPGTVKSTISRGLDALRDRYEEER